MTATAFSRPRGIDQVNAVVGTRPFPAASDLPPIPVAARAVRGADREAGSIRGSAAGSLVAVVGLAFGALVTRFR